MVEGVRTDLDDDPVSLRDDVLDLLRLLEEGWVARLECGNSGIVKLDDGLGNDVSCEAGKGVSSCSDNAELFNRYSPVPVMDPVCFETSAGRR